MNYFEKKIGIFFLLLTIPLLFLPKINLIAFQSESAGLRIDDLVLFGVGILLFWAHVQLHNQLFRIEAWILALTFFGVLSVFSNQLLVNADLLLVNAKILYALRLLEYFIFFYLGALSAHYFSGKKIIQALFLWNVVLMVLQKAGYMGAISVDGFRDDVSHRVFGVASFPSEMGLILNLFFSYFMFDDTSRSKITKLFPVNLRPLIHEFYPYWMFALFGIFVTFTGNRISMLALLICFIYKIKSEFKWRSLSPFFAFSALLPFLAGLVYLISTTEAVYTRSADLLSFNNFKLINIVWQKIDLTGVLGDGVTASKEYDMSWWMRIHKWIFMAKLYVYHPECYLQGLGPGTSGAALDGGFLRILVEYGLIGSWLFWKFFSTIGRINNQLKWMTIAFAINMIFFDAYLAYKAMSIFLFIGGQAFEAKSLKKVPVLKTDAVVA